MRRWKTNKLTSVQAEVLKTIATWYEEKREYPSLGEIARERRKARNGAARAVRYLEEKGYLRRRGQKDFEILPMGLAYLTEEMNPW